MDEHARGAVIHGMSDLVALLPVAQRNDNRAKPGSREESDNKLRPVADKQRNAVTRAESGMH